MWKTSVNTKILLSYGVFLFLASFFIVPTVTSFYYYAWGQHLAWSYFDGPPMIAYLFRLAHSLFGNTYFSINIVGLLCVLLGAYYIYRIGGLLRDKNTGLVSAMIWLVLPTTTESVYIRVLYDSPLNLFTIMSLYYCARYVVDHRSRDIYITALCLGAMLISKYTAAVTLVSFLLYFIASRQRSVFRNGHFYLATLLILGVASPVIWWNIQHDWISITYLLHFHSQANNKVTVLHSLSKLFGTLLINFSLFLLLVIIGCWKDKQTENTPYNPVLELIQYTLLFAVAFWLIVTLLGGDCRAIYLAPLGINIALAAGYYIMRWDYSKLFTRIFPIFLTISIAMIVFNAWPLASVLKKGKTYALIEEAEQKNLLKKEYPLTTGYFANTALLDFFVPHKQNYAIPCEDINQYQYWNDAFLKKIARAKVPKITYVDFEDSQHCPEKFFQHCASIATLTSTIKNPWNPKKTKPVSMYIYECEMPYHRTNNLDS